MTRGSIDDKVRRIVWVRCGGRCFMCNADLLDGDVAQESIYTIETGKGRALGDLAHMVGASDSDVSPRGKADPEVVNRESVDNLVLACPSHHRQIDTALGEGLYDLGFLRAMKAKHEAAIKAATESAALERSTPIRLLGDIEGGAIGATVNQCAKAILETENRLPGWSAGSYDPDGVEIDLRQLPTARTDTYYAAACARIDETLEDVKRRHASNRLSRASIFAAAKVPLLVYFGQRFDDTIPATLYQRHKVEQDWSWPDTDTHVEFQQEVTELSGPSEIVLSVGVTATPDLSLLTGDTAGLPRWSIAAATRGDSVINSLTALHDFEHAVRSIYTLIDEAPVNKVHLIAAVPVAAAVTLGRALDRSHHVPLVVYERNATGYAPAVEVTA